MATMILKDVTPENFLAALQGKHTGRKVIKRFACLLRYISVVFIFCVFVKMHSNFYELDHDITTYWSKSNSITF